MSDQRTVPYPCKCNSIDPEHTVEDQGDGWKRYVCSSCGGVKYALRGGTAEDPNRK